MFVVENRNHHDAQKGQGKSTVAFRFYRELTAEILYAVDRASCYDSW